MRVRSSRPSTKSLGGCIRTVLALFVLATSGSVGELTAQGGPMNLFPGEELLEIRLVDGSVLFGTITSVDGDVVVVTTAGGTRIELQRSQIRSARPPEGRMVDGEFWRQDPNRSRLFFTATGRTLEKGHAYIGTYLVILPFVAVGVTDRFTLGGGAPVIFGEFEPFYLAPKLQLIGTDEAGIAVGALHFVFSDTDEDIGILYGVGTFGDDDRAVTVGMGFGYAGSDFSSEPVAMIGAEIRAGPRVKLITENYFLPDDTGVVLSFGLRFIGERFSADVGMAGAVGDGAGCCVPLLNFAYSFGGRR